MKSLPITAAKEEELRSLAIAGFAALGGWGMARVDFLQSESDKLYINEVNTLPGFTSISMYPRLWGISGKPLPALVDQLVNIAMARHPTHQNPVAERWIGGCRRELFDQVVVFSERHAVRLARAYTGYFHEDRTHLGLGKDTPWGRHITPRPSESAKIVALPRVGGLHHRYKWREAA